MKSRREGTKWRMKCYRKKDYTVLRCLVFAVCYPFSVFPLFIHPATYSFNRRTTSTFSPLIPFFRSPLLVHSSFTPSFDYSPPFFSSKHANSTCTLNVITIMSTLSSESNREIVSYSLSNIAADVELYVSKKIYHVHSFILRQFSSFFEASLSSKWWKDENTTSDGSSIKYRYHLVPDESGDYIFEPFAPGSVSPLEGRDCDVMR